MLVVPSIWWENSPLTIHEAFLAGIPVITANAGGMAEFVRQEISGLLFRHPQRRESPGNDGTRHPRAGDAHPHEKTTFRAFYRLPNTRDRSARFVFKSDSLKATSLEVANRETAVSS